LFWPQNVEKNIVFARDHTNLLSVRGTKKIMKISLRKYAHHFSFQRKLEIAIKTLLIL